MEDIRISLDATGRNGDVNIVRVDGVIDTMTATELERVMDSLLEQRKYSIIIDLAGVDYISSAGWGIFISNIREIRSNSGDIKLARMIPSVYEIFELLEFDSILQAFESIDKARSDFKMASSQTDSTDGAPSGFEAQELVADGKPEAVTTEEYRSVEPEKQVPLQQVDHTKTTGLRDIKSQVLALVKDDPFCTIRELVKLVNSSKDGTVKRTSWWSVWNILRRNSLLSKRKRFRYNRR